MNHHDRAGLAVAGHLEIAVADRAGVVARSPTTQHVFRGEEYALALRLLGTAGDREELAAALRAEGTAADAAERAVDDLLTSRVLVEDAGDQSASWSAAGVSASTAAERLAATPVALAATGSDAGGVRAALAGAGVTVADDALFVLVLADDYLDEALRARNDAALESGEPWMLATFGTEAWIGPVFVPDRGPCWECLAKRLRAHRAAGGLDDAETIARPRPPLPAVRAAAEAALAVEVARWIVLGRATGRTERVLRIDPLSWTADEHVVVRRPQCAACGIGEEPLPAVARPVRLGPSAPTVAGLRVATPDTTYDRLAHHVSPITGVVAALAPARGARPPRHAYAAGALHVRVHPAGGELQASGGKGSTRDQARTGALCEALERHSGSFGGDEPRLAAAFDEVRDVAVHPADLMHFSQAQYERRDELNAQAETFRTFVPEQLDPSASIAWTPAWSLTSGRERLLPTAFCFYSAHVAGREACVAESNGNAGGNSLDEAILHGLLELVERDHVALWWFNRAHRPGLVLESFDDQWLDAVAAELRGEGRELWALDLTADLDIPVVAALATRRDGDGVVLGLGAHTEMRRAAARAVSELVQLDLAAPAAGLGTGPPPGFDEGYLRPDESTAARSAQDYPRAPVADLRAELDRCIGAVQAKGLEVIVLDQTRPDVGLPVAKVVVPGLRHFWPRFAPGRLYDVPVELGWIPAPLPEDELNPTPPAL